MRVRAFRVFNDPWAPDPQCYISDEEIGLTEDKKNSLKQTGEEYIIPKEISG
jgi:hypothetical protein